MKEFLLESPDTVRKPAIHDFDVDPIRTIGSGDALCTRMPEQPPRENS